MQRHNINNDDVYNVDVTATAENSSTVYDVQVDVFPKFWQFPYAAEPRKISLRQNITPTCIPDVPIIINFTLISEKNPYNVTENASSKSIIEFKAQETENYDESFKKTFQVVTDYQPRNARQK